MKKFETNYKKIIDKIELSNNDKELIKKNIIYNEYKPIYKNAFLSLSVFVLFFMTCLVANALVNHYKILKNEEFNKQIIFKGYVEKEYDIDLFVKERNYDIKDIEEKLDLVILDNKYVKDNLYNLYNITIKGNNITKLNFWLKDTLNKINIGFEVNTDKNATSLFSISGNADLKKYYIKNLNTEAVIYEVVNEYAGPLLANFEYNGIIYSVELDKVNYTLNDLYKILDAFSS